MIRHPSLAAVLAAAVVSAPALARDAAAPVATTQAGQVRGVTSDGVEAWLGIPFAAPPVGPLRWRAAQPVAPWTGVKSTAAYGNDCMQFPFPSDAAPLGTPPAEDCLYLNVWRPTAAKMRKLPVLVWIYGGGFLNGGASPPTYSGRELAAQGVMVVSFNYRLGRFGTFATPQLVAENRDGGLVANYGFLDQIAALKWVQRNVAAFGGDPANVTIVGESAGGFSVHTLVTSPLARGTFAKAVVMSGGDGGDLTPNELPELLRSSTRFAQSKGIAADDPQALAKLRALPAEELTGTLNMTALWTRDAPRTFSSPIMDGRISVNGAKAYRAGAFAHVPMMIGATSDDAGGVTGQMITGAKRAAAMLADQGVPVYAYRFSYVAESIRTPETKGAAHATDIPFFFNTQAVKYEGATTSRDNAMGRTISAYLVNFVKTGDPNGGGLPAWPRYNRKQDRIMDFAPNGAAVPGKDALGTQIDTAPPLAPLFPRDQ